MKIKQKISTPQCLLLKIQGNVNNTHMFNFLKLFSRQLMIENGQAIFEKKEN